MRIIIIYINKYYYIVLLIIKQYDEKRLINNHRGREGIVYSCIRCNTPINYFVEITTFLQIKLDILSRICYTISIYLTYWRYYMKVNWQLQIDNIKEYLKQGLTLEQVGIKYGVSKQRVYQVCTKFNIQTPFRARKSFLKDKPPKYYWLNKTLTHKGVNKQERLDILEKLSIPDTCPVLGTTLNYEGTGQGPGYTRTENSPSLDQIKPGEGYYLDNIAIISWRANRIKNDGTANEHQLIANYINLFSK